MKQPFSIFGILKKTLKMRKIFLLLLFPLFLSTQCEDDLDSGFETSYIVQNNSSIDLFLLTEDNRFLEIPIQSDLLLGSDLNSETEPIAPAESFAFSRINLYKLDNGNYILVYVQDPLNNDLWNYSEPVINKFEYVLVITDELLD